MRKTAWLVEIIDWISSLKSKWDDAKKWQFKTKKNYSHSLSAALLSWQKLHGGETEWILNKLSETIANSIFFIPDDSKSLFGVWVLTDRVSLCKISANGARWPSGIPRVNWKCEIWLNCFRFRSFQFRNYWAEMMITWLDSGRHECGWPGTKTSFSISWFKPSTELRIGRWVAHDLGGIDTGLAAIHSHEDRGEAWIEKTGKLNIFFKK